MANVNDIIARKVAEYDELRAKKKIIEDRMKVLADEIKSYSQKNGVKDEKGSTYVDNGAFIMGSVAKTTIKFDEPVAIKFLKDNGYTKAIITTEKINEKEVEKYIKAGLITKEQLTAITISNTTYSVSVTKKETVVDEVIEASVASEKPKNKLFSRRK